MAGQGRLFSEASREPESMSIVSYGAGQDSSALLLKLMADDDFRQRWAPGRLMTVIAHTGDEHGPTLDYVGRMRGLCEKEGIEFYFLEAGGPYHTEAWSDLISHYRRNDTIGSKAFPKACSSNLKIQVIYRFLEELLSKDYGVAHGNKRGIYEYTALTGEPIGMLLGVSAEEQGRVEKEDSAPKWMTRNIERRYPLMDLGWDRQVCQDYILSMEQPLPIPSLCRRCPFKSEADLVLMEHEDQEGLTEWISLEKAKLEASAEKFPDLPPEKNLGVFGKRSLPQALEDARERYGHLSYDELHQMRMAGHGVRSCY